MIKVSPSILAADFANLERDIKMVGNAAMLHLDVMDGHFVPNISFGVPVIHSIRNITDMCFDVHLMISNPGKYVDAFVEAGADMICFHLEAEGEAGETITRIHSSGKKTAIALKPETPAEAVFPYLDRLDMVLVMTVEPGFGGQSFMADMLDKISVIRRRAGSINPNLMIQVDGGIDRKTGKRCVDAGADVLVAGSSVFGAKDPAKEIEALSSL